jgi:hypothetical protein
MGRISIDGAVWAGFRVIAREPVAFLVWAGVFLVLAMLPALWSASQMLPYVSQIAAGGQPSIEQMRELQTRVAGAQPISYLGSLLAQTLLAGAIFRAVLAPQERSFFYLRLTAREGWMALAGTSLVVLLVLASLVLAIPMIFALVISRVTTGGPPQGFSIGLLPLAMFLAGIWVVLRYSMGPLLSWSERTYRLFESWAFTRGWVLMMLAVGVSVVVIVLCGEVVLFSLLVLAVNAIVPLQSLPAAMANDPKAVLALFTPVHGIVALVLFSLLATWGLVMFGAAWAEMFRQITAPEAPAPVVSDQVAPIEPPHRDGLQV